LLICLLLYMNFGSVTDMLLAASVIPMALIGGIFALFLTGTPFSVSAAIGFVALFGIAAMDGIIVLSYYNQHIVNGMDRASAIVRTCQVQMRPVMMTCCRRHFQTALDLRSKSRWHWSSLVVFCWRRF